jgi:exodeoxyribonuclease V
MIWNTQQDNALKEVEKWFNNETHIKPVFRIFGFAGSGKSTLARHFAEHINGTVCYAAYTGKAALVMRNNGCVGASTIHRLIYKVNVDDKGNVSFSINRTSPLTTASLLIIDECSMVDEKIAKDLLSFKIPILVLGDPAQLPPVSGEGYFTNVNPDIMLTEIHRQASDNPIIYMANKVRNGEKLQYGTYGESVILSELNDELIFEADQVLVGRNNTRETFNSYIRNTCGINDLYPIEDEKLICLKNDHSIGIYNGGMFTVTKKYNKNIADDFCSLGVLNDDEESHPLYVNVHKSFFNPLYTKPHWAKLKETHQFTFGYAITVNKSQGSQWQNCTIIDESWCFRDDWNKWLYTAITRASEKVTIIQ